MVRWTWITLPVLLIASSLMGSSSRGDEPTQVHLTLTAAQKPLRFDRYRLVFARDQMRPGPAATLMYRGIVGQSLRDRNWVRRDLDYEREVMDLWQAPDDEFHPKDARRLIQHYQRALRDLALAARSTEPGWNFPYEEGLDMSLEETNYARVLSRVLAIQIRMQLFEGDFAGAVENLRIGFAFAKQLMQSEFVVLTFVGLNVADCMFVEVERWMQFPNAPSLYWALLELRTHVLPDAAEQFQNDLGVLMELELPFSIEQLSEPLSPSDQQLLSRKLQESFELYDLYSSEFGEFGIWDQRHAATTTEEQQAIFAMTLVQYVAAARQKLLEVGYSSDEIQALPVVQIVALARRLNESQFLSQAVAAAALPYPQAVEQYQLLQSEMAQRRRQSGLSKLLVDIDDNGLRILKFVGQRDRRLAELTVCAALRLYLGEHAGELPESLEQLNPSTPAPLDPLTLQPFEYERGGEAARLEPPAELRTPLDRIYQISVLGDGMISSTRRE